MASNYPDGMRESDLPGWWDVECPSCEEHWAETGEDANPDCDWCEGVGMIDGRPGAMRARWERMYA